MIRLIFVLLLMFGLSACGSNTSKPSDSSNSPQSKIVSNNSSSSNYASNNNGNNNSGSSNSNALILSPNIVPVQNASRLQPLSASVVTVEVDAFSISQNLTVTDGATLPSISFTKCASLYSSNCFTSALLTVGLSLQNAQNATSISVINPNNQTINGTCWSSIDPSTGTSVKQCRASISFGLYGSTLKMTAGMYQVIAKYPGNLTKILEFYAVP